MKRYVDVYGDDYNELTKAEVDLIDLWRQLPAKVRKALRHFIKLRLRD
jgi:hypothetical protein